MWLCLPPVASGLLGGAHWSPVGVLTTTHPHLHPPLPPPSHSCCLCSAAGSEASDRDAGASRGVARVKRGLWVNGGAQQEPWPPSSPPLPPAPTPFPRSTTTTLVSPALLYIPCRVLIGPCSLLPWCSQARDDGARQKQQQRNTHIMNKHMHP